MGMISKKAGGASALSLALGAAMMMAQPVSAAATFDFAGLAIDAGEQFWDDVTDSELDTSEGSFSGNTWTINSIGVIATGSGVTGSKAYLDGPSGGRDGGLGVCDGCSPSSNDNTGIVGGGAGAPTASNPAEELKLTFVGGPVKIDSIIFRNREHYELDNSLFNLTFNGVANYANTIAGSVGNMFTFAINPLIPEITSPLSAGIRDFYVDSITVSAVPLPGGVLLLGSALGGLGLMKRRRKAA